MAKYRKHLPQLDGKLYLADGGMGTSLIFHSGVDVPLFCAFPLLDQPETRDLLVDYFRDYTRLARDQQVGFILDSGPTWRASADWGARLGYSANDLERVNRDAIDMMCELRHEFETDASPIVISGCMGPRGDGYAPGDLMTPEEARTYHCRQIETFADTAADFVTAMTLTYSDEAVGIAKAAESVHLPSVISFTVETDGRLPTGQDLGDAINFVDDQTSGAPVYYMINCAHPTHFDTILETGSNWINRIKGIRLNASCLSHAELDEATELDDGDSIELATQVATICARFPHINVVGGCCGTDHRHIHEMGKKMQEVLA